MRKRRNREFEQGEEVSEVNVTPLADVSLTLVIMMMVISPMIFQSMIEVKSAQAVATGHEARENEKPLFIDITKNGFTVNTKKVGTEYQLMRVLQRQLSRNAARPVLITSAPEVEYQNVIRILDLVKQTGGNNLSLVPRKKA